MKNIIAKILILGFISISIFSSSCKDVSEGNNFKLLDTTIYIEGCNVVNMGLARPTPYATYEYKVTFYSPDVTYDELTDTYSGKGSWVTVKMLSSSNTGVLHGQYTFDSFNTKDSLTINYGSLSMYEKFFDASTGCSISMGIVDLAKSGNNYDFKIELYSTKGIFEDLKHTPIVGFYNGTVKEIAKKP